MRVRDFVILGIILLWAALVLFFWYKKKKSGGCIGCGGGSCDGCVKKYAKTNKK